jgi:predicted dehydrogenase
MKLAIIGCGYISKVHLAASREAPEASIVALVDRDAKVYY